MPITATLSVGLMSNWTSGLNTVTPPQNRGPADSNRSLRDRDDAGASRADLVREATVVADNGGLRLGAEVLIAR